MAIVEQKLPPALAARVMSVSDLASWGMPMVAYVRRMAVGEWAICSADGTRIGTAPDRPSALAAIHQHDLEAQSVH